MSNIDLKYQITELHNKALDSINPTGRVHPVRIVQSVKSIIGIKPDHPLDNLLKFCSNYLEEYNTNTLEYNKEEEIPEVVTFADLELSLKNKDLDESNKNACYLTKVSDSKHILEFLLEISIKYDLDCFYTLWSVYKMMLFLKGENILKNILFCIREIVIDPKDFYLNDIKSQNIDLNQYHYSKDTFELLMLYYSILKEDFVRIENICRYIKNNISTKFRFNFNVRGLNVEDVQKYKGRQWINDFASTVDIDLLSVDMILILESCRGALKISNGIDDHIIWHNLNQYLKENVFK